MEEEFVQKNENKIFLEFIAHKFQNVSNFKIQNTNETFINIVFDNILILYGIVNKETIISNHNSYISTWDIPIESVYGKKTILNNCSGSYVGSGKIYEK